MKKTRKFNFPLFCAIDKVRGEIEKKLVGHWVVFAVKAWEGGN